MSYPIQRTITNILAGALILTAYCIYAFGKYQAGAVALGDLKFWATTMLIFIGIGIVVMIIVQIVFHILLSIAIAVKEKVQDQNCGDQVIEKNIKAEIIEDEMDRLIELKSMRFGFAIAGTGFVAALVSLALDASPAVMLNILFISFSAGSILEGFARLFFYFKGVKHA